MNDFSSLTHSPHRHAPLGLEKFYSYGIRGLAVCGGF